MASFSVFEVPRLDAGTGAEKGVKISDPKVVQRILAKGTKESFPVGMRRKYERKLQRPDVLDFASKSDFILSFVSKSGTRRTVPLVTLRRRSMRLSPRSRCGRRTPQKPSRLQLVSFLYGNQAIFPRAGD